jgi:predicted permease
MSILFRLFRKLRFFISRERFERELAEEMAFHCEQHEEQLRSTGVGPDSAHYRATRQFGNSVRLRERSYEVIEFQFETALQDLRYSFRQLRKNPAFAVTAILVLSLGIGATVSIFAFVDALLIRPLPFHDPNRLADVTESITMIPRANLSYLDYLDWKRLNNVFSSLDVYNGTGYLLRTDTGVEPVVGTRVSDGFFRTLGVTPSLGRDFYGGEDLPAAPHTVILSYGTWQSRFGGKKDVIGQAVSLSGVDYVIVGVLPRDFQFPPRGGTGFWTSLHASDSCSKRRSCHNMNGIGRLKDGVSFQTALAEMKVIASQLEKQYPDSNRGQGATVLPFSEVVVGKVRPILLALLSAAGLLLLIACVNIASLLLVRSESRKREIAVRGALGASRSRLMRQFFIEASVLVCLGSLTGLLFAYAATQWLVKLIPPQVGMNMPQLQALGLHSHTIVFVAVVAGVAVLLFSVTPLVRLPLSEIRNGLNEAGRTSAGLVWRRLGSNLVVVELALAMVLLTGAGLLGKSLYRLLHVDLGFEPDHLATVTVAGDDVKYSKDEQSIVLGREILHRVSALPGVQSAALATRPPVSFNGNTTWIRILGHPYNGEHNEVNERHVSGAFFTTLKAKLLAGRYFDDSEDESKPNVVIINHALAEKYFPGEDPIGKKIGDTSLSPKSLQEVIGVVDDVRDGPLDAEIWPAVYVPFNQGPDDYFTVLVRTAGDEHSLLPEMSAAIRRIDPGLGILDQISMMDRINSSESAYLHRSSTWVIAGFAGLALLLGVIGLYGVIAYSVSRRTREIGVRMALGAERLAVYRMVLQEAGGLTFLGIAAGFAISIFAASLIRKLLFGVSSWDLTTLLSVAAVLGAAAMLASFLPARRAASVNPTEALRTE